MLDKRSHLPQLHIHTRTNPLLLFPERPLQRSNNLPQVKQLTLHPPILGQPSPLLMGGGAPLKRVHVRITEVAVFRLALGARAIGIVDTVVGGRVLR